MANGMMTTIRYEGAQPPIAAMPLVASAASAPAAPSVGNLQTLGAHAHGAAPPAAIAPPARALAIAETGGDLPEGATKVAMVDNRFQPGRITVPAGTAVIWENNGANVHTVSAQNGSFDSGAIPPGKAFTFSFDQPGEYAFLCRQHLLNGMTGVVTVK